MRACVHAHTHARVRITLSLLLLSRWRLTLQRLRGWAVAPAGDTCSTMTLFWSGPKNKNHSHSCLQPLSVQHKTCKVQPIYSINTCEKPSSPVPRHQHSLECLPITSWITVTSPVERERERMLQKSYQKAKMRSIGYTGKLFYSQELKDDNNYFLLWIKKKWRNFKKTFREGGTWNNSFTGFLFCGIPSQMCMLDCGSGWIPLKLENFPCCCWCRGIRALSFSDVASLLFTPHPHETHTYTLLEREREKNPTNQ